MKKPAGNTPRRVLDLLPLLAEFVTRPQAGTQIGASECYRIRDARTTIAGSTVTCAEMSATKD
jgi:hypothetical protein